MKIKELLDEGLKHACDGYGRDRVCVKIAAIAELPSRFGDFQVIVFYGFAPKVNLRLMVRQAHHERKYENPFVLSLSKGDLAKQGTFGAKLSFTITATTTNTLL